MRGIIMRILLLLLIFTCFLPARESEIDTALALSYFPLHVGNQWEYIVTYGSSDPTHFETITVTRDTTISGHHYYILDGSHPIGKYIRIDTSTLSVIEYSPQQYSACNDSEIVVFELNLPQKENITMLDTTCLGNIVNQGTFYNQVGTWTDSSNMFYYIWYDSLLKYYWLAENIGLSDWSFWEGSRAEGHLVSAKINGVTHNNYTTLGDKYFPLQIGNTWQYSCYSTTPYDTMYNENCFIKSIVGDTLAPNGYIYYVIQRDTIIDTHSIWVRYDSNTDRIMVYDTLWNCTNNEYVYVDFMSLKGGYWIYNCADFTEVEKRLQYYNFADSVLSIISVMPNGSEGGYILAEDIGFVGDYYNLAGYVSEYELVACTINGKQYGSYVGVNENSFSFPDQIILHQNYPNPFNPLTTIRYELPRQIHVRLAIFDLLGREVAVLVDAVKEPGINEVVWDAGDLASGIYFYRLQTETRMITEKMVLLK